MFTFSVPFRTFLKFILVYVLD